MKKILVSNSFYILLAFVLFLTACDTDGDETLEWGPSTQLGIIGAAEVDIAATIADKAFPLEYYVEGYTVKKTYTWTVNGSPVAPERGGEFISLDLTNKPGTYVIKVSNGTHEGTLTVVAK